MSAPEGMALLQAGNLRDAELRFRSALGRDVRDAQALLGLGIIAHQTGHFAAALELYDRALAADPALAAAQVNRGNALAAMQRYAEAVVAFEAALALAPALPSALINLATALHALGRLDEAVAALERARTREPGSPELLNNLGNFYKDQGRLGEALACYRRVLELNPMMQQAASNRLAALKVDASLTPRQLLDEHRHWSNWFEAVSAHAPLLANTPDAIRRLRIGYVSPDCHTAIPAFLDGVIAAHDRGQFEVFGYFNNPPDPRRLQALGVTDRARVMRGRDDQQVAAQIHDDAIDILIDIAGHTGHNRLGVFARRPAPVQITWLDYLCTTGLAAMDYRITDAVADPPGNEAFHCEQLLRLPHTQWCWQADAGAPEVSSLPANRCGHITFGSFNNAQKLTDDTLGLWRRLLAMVPTARIRFAGIPEGAARTRVRAGLAGEGRANDVSRIEFLPRMSVADYRAAFADVDIALDPQPFSGATTTLDALWQGVPVLTLPGARSCSRSTASLLSALGLAGWIAGDEADFLARASRLAADTAGLAELRATLRERMRASPIMDLAGFSRDLDALLRQAWRAWCEQRVAAADRPDCMAGSDGALRHIRAALDAGRQDEALAILQPLLKTRPQWELAQRELARACLAWSRAHPAFIAAWRRPFARIEAPQSISAIVCSIRPEYFAHIERVLREQFARHKFELIGIHDARSLCEAYNRGAARASGDILIFCHDDIDIVHADFGERLLRHLESYDVIGVAGASKLVNADWGHAGPPHVHGQIVHKPRGQEDFLYFCAGLQAPVMENQQALDGVFIGMHRKVWEALRFDEASFDGFHGYDIDFTYRAYRAGHRLAVPADLLLIHFSTGGYDLGWQAGNLRFLRKFATLSNLPAMRRHAHLHVKFSTLEPIERLHCGLLHHHFGA
ncbi:MAG: tetratricopeptide repeat protein [Betaproteobacteria bacterium]